MRFLKSIFFFFLILLNITTVNAQNTNRVVIVPLGGEEGITYTANSPIVISTPDPNKPDEQVISFTAPADQVVDKMQPSLALNYVIATQGVYPSRNMSSQPYLAGISLFAGTFAPRGWAFCSGQLLAISSNQALFSLVGTIYGGDGRTTFGLPDLRGRVAVGSEGNATGPGLTQRRLGAKFGSERVTIDHR